MLDPEEDVMATASLLAPRSPEGHAAKGMQIKGKEDLWIEIQAHTFRNWVNEHLRPLGHSVSDLSTDFCDGTRLLFLVEALQKRTLRGKVLKPQNQHQMLENVTRALDAVKEDGVKLVNIGPSDIVSGHLKLILGLIWSLILRYQIGPSKFPPKKLMLAWLRSVLPENGINNFTSDWKNGKNLSALVDYCRPGLIPHWKQLNEYEAERNCRNAMEIAKRELGVPMVLDPDYLASGHLDELSGMTYLSYFMKDGGGPGWRKVMTWVRDVLPKRRINNFTTDWNNGILLCELVRALGGPVPGIDGMSLEQTHWEENVEKGMKGGEKLGVTPLLKAKDMADPGVDHLGVMGYISQFQWLPKRTPPGERVQVHWETEIWKKGDPVQFTLEEVRGLRDEKREEIYHSEITVEVKGPSGNVESRVTREGEGRYKGRFTATEIGIHEVVVKYQGEPVIGSPLKGRVVPKKREVTFESKGVPGLPPCVVGSLVEVLVNPQDTTSPAGAKREFLEVIAVSPSGRRLECFVERAEDSGDAHGFAATFKPDEAGLWKVTVLYKGKDIQGSPWDCFVYDPNCIVLDTLSGAMPGLPFAFICDSRGTGGVGEVEIDVCHEGRSIPYNTEFITEGVKRILLPVLHAGKHKVHVYFNGTEIRGSPFSLRVGYSGGKTRKSGHGKTRSFDTTGYQGVKGHSLSQGQSLTRDYASASSEYKQSSTSFDEAMTRKDLYKERDTTDAVHPRFKSTAAAERLSPSDAYGISGKLQSTRLSSSDNLNSFSEATRMHHEESLIGSRNLREEKTIKEEYQTKTNGAHPDIRIRTGTVTLP